MKLLRKSTTLLAGMIAISGIFGAGSACAYTHYIYSTPWGDDYQSATFQVQSDFGSMTKQQIADGMVHLNGKLIHPFLSKSSSDTTATRPLENGIKTINKASDGQNGTIAENFAYTNFWGTYVIECDILVNTAYPFANSAQQGAYDIQSVITHELGHVLRVGHSTDFYDTMVTGWVGSKYMNTTIRRDLTTDDTQAVKDSTARWLK